MITSNDMFELAGHVQSAETMAKDAIVMEMQKHIRSEARKGHVEADFEVPVIEAGLPAFDYKTVCSSIEQHFKKGGFIVHHAPLGMFHFDWGTDTQTKNNHEVKIVYSTRKKK
jgi:hypothetical protein